MIEVKQLKLIFPHLPFCAVLAECKHKSKDQISRALLPIRLLRILYRAKRIDKVLCVVVDLVPQFLNTDLRLPKRQEGFSRRAILAITQILQLLVDRTDNADASDEHIHWIPSLRGERPPEIENGHLVSPRFKLLLVPFRKLTLGVCYDQARLAFAHGQDLNVLIDAARRLTGTGCTDDQSVHLRRRNDFHLPIVLLRRTDDQRILFVLEISPWRHSELFELSHLLDRKPGTVLEVVSLQRDVLRIDAVDREKPGKDQAIDRCDCDPVVGVQNYLKEVEPSDHTEQNADDDVNHKEQTRPKAEKLFP